jgi:hypothetical protein
MAIQFPRVKAGDVIQAQQWNAVLDSIEYLYGQLGTQVTSNLQITGFQPPGPVNVGDTISVLGSNFEYTIGAISVYFESVKVDNFLAGSGDSQLVVTVPQIPNLPPGGRLVTVTAYNRTSNDQKTITVMPVPLALSGFIDVLPGTAAVAQPGTTADFQFTVNSRVNQTANFTVVAKIDQQGWQTQILAADKTPLQTGLISLVPFAPTQIYARVTVPATAAPNTPYSLTLNVSSGGTVYGTTGPVPHTLGQADAQQDTSIQIGQASANPPSGLAQGGTISAPLNGTVNLTIPTTFTLSPQAAYTVSIAPVGALNSWLVKMNFPPGPVSTAAQPASSATFTPALGSPQLLQLAVQPTAGASATGTLQLTIQRQGATTAATKNFPVTLATSG